MSEPASPGTPETEHRLGARFFHDHRRALGYAALMLAGLGALFVAIGEDARAPVVQPLDDWWYRAMFEIRTPVATLIAKTLDVLGGAYVTMPLRVAIAVWLAWRRRWPDLAAWLLTWALSEILVTGAKAWFDRPRPPGTLVRVSGASFPSGHATAAAATGLALVLVLLPAGRRRTKWEWIAVGVAFLMSLSRTYLHAHWLTDTIAGSLLGAGVAIGAAGVVRELRDRIMHRRGFPLPPRTTRRAARRRPEAPTDASLDRTSPGPPGPGPPGPG